MLAFVRRFIDSVPVPAWSSAAGMKSGNSFHRWAKEEREPEVLLFSRPELAAEARHRRRGVVSLCGRSWTHSVSSALAVIKVLLWQRRRLAGGPRLYFSINSNGVWWGNVPTPVARPSNARGRSSLLSLLELNSFVLFFCSFLKEQNIYLFIYN